jgi:hypothetical protein
VLIGYYTTEAIKRVEVWVEYVALGISVLFVLGVLFEGRRLIRQWDRDEQEASDNVQ